MDEPGRFVTQDAKVKGQNFKYQIQNQTAQGPGGQNPHSFEAKD